jgi:two-component system KDP operon response regulator KdpE
MANKKILIVDDDPELRLGLSVRLKANHYDTVFAADAVTAVAEARKTRPDLILLDLGLPGGDGFTVMERLASNVHLSAIPVIVVSARDRAAYGDRALKAGAKALLSKPVNNRDLLGLIRQLLGEQPHPETGA